MKRILKGNFAIIVLLSIFFISACTGKAQEGESASAAKHTCPMHPEIINEGPGICPICKMDLVPMQSTGKDAGRIDTLETLVKPTNQFVVSDIATIKPEKGSKVQDIIVRGIINYNMNGQNSVSSRVNGRIEKLYVKYNYQPVSKGQKLMDVYSPDLASAQQELLFLKNSNELVLLEQAKKKLRLLGSTEQQIKRVLSTGKIDYTVSIYSPYSGYVSELQNVSSSSAPTSSAGGTVISSESGNSSSSMGGMGASSGTVSNPSSVPDVGGSTPLQLREGQYVSVGQRLFNLVNSNVVWAEFYVNPEKLDEFKKGTMISIQSVDVETKNRRVPVSLIQPYYNEGTNYSLVRATVSNANNLWKVGELITVKNESTRNTGTWLPRTAVLQLGSRYVSFIKKTNAFIPVYVDVKALSGEWADIGNSIDEDLEVAVNAWFLVDSESFINVQNLTAQ